MTACPHCGEDLPETPEEWQPQPAARTWTFEPVTVNGKQYDSITFRAPTFKEMKLAAAKRFDERGKEVANADMLVSEKLAALITGLDLTVIDRIPAYIIGEGCNYANSFTSGPN